jgi:hypothetical protein
MVVQMDDSPRTQNGHIRNDTRDASRRILESSSMSICRRNCSGLTVANREERKRGIHDRARPDRVQPFASSLPLEPHVRVADCVLDAALSES